jgi:hypothetical protein
MNDHIKILKSLSKKSLVLLSSNMLEELFKNEIIDTHSLESSIGKDCDYADKEDWLCSRLRDSINFELSETGSDTI